MKYINGDVKWGIIGCGDVCEVKSGPAFSKATNSTLVAVMRRNGKKAKDFAERHGVPKFYDSAEKLIADAEVNAVYIATPPAFHEEYALKAMAAGKPVYIEKPVTTDAASCQKLMEFAEKYKIPAVCAHYRRELSLFKKVKELLHENALGEIKLIDLRLFQSPSKNIIAKTEDNWRIKPEISGGGLFHDLAPHQLDIMLWLFGVPQESWGKSMNKDHEYEAPDMVSLEILFAQQTYFHGLWAFNVPENSVVDNCTIIGEKGRLSFPFFRDPTLLVETDAIHESLKLEYPRHVQQPFIEQVVRYFRGETKNPCSLAEALVTMQLIDKTA